MHTECKVITDGKKGEGDGEGQAQLQVIRVRKAHRGDNGRRKPGTKTRRQRKELKKTPRSENTQKRIKENAARMI